MSERLTSAKGFEVLMVEVDSRLRQKGVAIPARPFHAVPLVAEAVKITDEIPIDSHATGSDITAETLFAHVHRWYQEHYGDRLKTHVGPGTIALRIRGEAWKATLPLVYGSVEFMADRRLTASSESPGYLVGRRGTIPSYNILDSIESLPRSLASALTDDELRDVFDEFLFAFTVLRELASGCRNDVLLQAAFTDLDVAVERLVSVSPDYGLSRWSSLQFAEKSFKSALNKAGIPYSRTHTLSKLAKLGAENSVFTLDLRLLADIQCSAGVRYGEQPTSLDEALTAHRSSIRAVSALTR